MPSPITFPTSYVPPFAVSFADAAGQAALVAATSPLPVSGSFTPVFAASGKTAVAGSIASGAQSAAFSPLPGRDFNVTIAGTGAAQLERQFSGDATWYVVLTDSQRLTLPPSFAFNEGEAAVSYRVSVLSGGPFQVRLSQ